MSRLILSLMSFACAPQLVAPAAAPVRLARAGALCEPLPKAVLPTRPLPDLDLGEGAGRPSVPVAAPEIPRLAEAWRAAASCGAVGPVHVRLADVRSAMEVVTWLVPYAEELARAGEADAALELLTDVWRVGAGIRHGGVAADSVGLAMQARVAYALNDPTSGLPDGLAAERAAELLGEIGAAPSIGQALSLESDGSWWDRACVAWGERAAGAVEPLPVERRPDAWRDATTWSRWACPWLDSGRELLSGEAELVARLTARAAPDLGGAPRGG